MRKATLYFLLIICSILAFGQEPQWIVVKHVVLFDQKQPILKTTLLTPAEANFYRLTVYISGGGGRPSASEAFVVDVNGTDVSGQSWDLSPVLPCNILSVIGLPPYTLISKPNLPLTYEVYRRPASVLSSDCTYNLAITVEQLVQ